MHDVPVSPLDPLVAHKRALDAFSAVLSNVTADQLDAPTPCTDWSVRDLVGHVIAGNRRTAAVGTADAGTAATGPPAARAGDEDLDELVASYGASASAAQASFEAPGGLTRTFELSFGTLPATRVIGMRATDVLAHAWDLARATGQPTAELDPELATELLEAASARVRPELRGPGKPFAEEQPCAPDAPAADRLAAFLGRKEG